MRERGQPISAEELFDQLIRSVAVLAASPSAQDAWLTARRLPVEELILPLYDKIPGWFYRFREEGLLTDAAESALVNLRFFIESLSFDELIKDWSSTTLASDWKAIQSEAQTALGILKR